MNVVKIILRKTVFFFVISIFVLFVSNFTWALLFLTNIYLVVIFYNFRKFLAHILYKNPKMIFYLLIPLFFYLAFLYICHILFVQ